jgi:serine/threonine protein kinase
MAGTGLCQRRVLTGFHLYLGTVPPELPREKGTRYSYSTRSLRFTLGPGTFLYSDKSPMTQPDGPIRGSLSLVGTQKTQRDLLLATDDPDATLVGNTRHETMVATPELVNPTLSSGALAALGQRYDVLGEAGHGSMGSVYKARDRETGEVVAIKLLKPEIASDQKMVERFKNELLFARKITHKNVCRVYDFNRAGSIAYTSMEYVEGESLRSVLNRFGGLPQRKAIYVALQICSGLKEAHAQGIVHRDLKPENVMVDPQGNVKIMDFGIARSMEAGTNLTGSMVGTPAYMAPEQVSGKPVDFRTDIYALGLMLYEMFTGSQAFRADTAMAVALKQIQESPAPPHTLDPGVPVQIERAILKCLEKDPAKRFQSMAELERTLSAFGRAGSGTQTLSYNTPIAPVPTIAAPSPVQPVHVKPAPRGTWALLWVLLGAAAVLAAGAGAKWIATAKALAQISLPAAPATPKVPDIAFGTPQAQSQPPSQTPATASSAAPAPALSSASAITGSTSTAKPDVKKVAAAALDIPVIDKPKDADASVAPAPTAPVKPQPQQQQPNQIPSNQLAANTPPAGRGVAQPNGAPANASQPIAPGEDIATTFVWVGRFQKEDRAQNTMKRLEDLQLPAMVVPRKGPQGDFYIVLTGPFPKQKAANVKQRLESQGFENTHFFTLPATNQKPGTNP